MTTTRNHRRIFTITAVVAAAALILVLALTALNRGSETAPAAGPAGANNVDRIEITSVDGKALTVPSTRPTVLYFMASGCYTCVPQAEAMKELEQEYADKADFVAVDVTPETTKPKWTSSAKWPAHPDTPSLSTGPGNSPKSTRSHPWTVPSSSHLTVTSWAGPIPGP